ncbi:SRPBCC family protein [Flagellimonas meishanensis]|uniref:SRPBCC family protein n=1 Tax=Flagellimonas meishanensis TaxID=2873264 RepID=UPI001CA63E1A|nr:SRPBCC domain-containing protein [[Muricauda] meishanensis]
MKKLSFDSFTKKIFIKASMDKLYWCWGTSEGICSWFLSGAKYTSTSGGERKPDEKIQPGDSYVWKWHNWDGQATGEVIEANGTDHLVITFEGSEVSVTLEDHKSAVLVTLHQYNIATDDESKLNVHYGCSNGWTFWLANLKAYLEHGILLNETEFDLRDIPLSGFEFVNV